MSSDNNVKSISDAKVKKSNKSKKNLGITIGSIIILILSAITFIFVPTMVKTASTGEALVFGKYNGEKIEYKTGTFFTNAVNSYANQYQQMGYELTQWDYYTLFNQAFQTTVINMAFADEVKKSGYKVPEQLVDRNMLRYFLDTNGNYSAKIFRDTPDSTKIAYRKSVEEELIYDRYFTDVFGDQFSVYYGLSDSVYGIKSSSKEADLVKEMNSKTRGFDMVSFSTGDFPKEEAASFGKANTDLFVKYDLSAVTVSDEATANSIKKQLDSNEVTFADAVANLSAQYYTNGEGKVTNSYAYQLKNMLTSDASVAAITSMKAGDVSDVIQTANGYAIFRCDNAATQPDFNDSGFADVAYNYMTIYEAGIIEDYFNEQASRFSIAAASLGFDEAASVYGVEVQSIDPFSLNYGSSALVSGLSSSVSVLSSAQSNEDFLKTAFSLKENEISSPIVMDGNIVVLKMTGEKLASAEDLAILDNESVVRAQFMNYDTSAAQSAVLNSGKVENNVFSVFLENML